MGMMAEDNNITSDNKNYSFYQGNIVLPHVQGLSQTQIISESKHMGESKNDQRNIMPIEREKRGTDISSVSSPRKENVDISESQLERRKKRKTKMKNKVKPSDDLHMIGNTNDNLFIPHKFLPKLTIPEKSQSTANANTEPPGKLSTSATQINVKSAPRISQENLVKSAETDLHSTDKELIDIYKSYLDSHNFDNTERNFSESDVSVSSLSESDNSINNDIENTLVSGTFEPLYSLPNKDKGKKATTKDLSNRFSKVVISNSKTSGNNDSSIELYQTGSLPDLHSLDNCQIKKVTHVIKNDSEPDSEPGAKIRYKVRPLPPIPGTSGLEVENSNLYETEDRVSKCDAVSPISPVRKTFKQITTLLTSIPRVPTNQVRGRKDDHQLADISKYLPDRKLKIFIGTWNMKGTKYLPESLDDFLLPAESLYLQDVYLIGTQEGTPFRHEWQLKLQETFGPSHVLVKASNFGVLQLSVFVRRELVWFCSRVVEDTAATRVAHKIKTKGALAMSFSIFGTSFLYINSHFTSHEGKLRERINDYNSICQNLHFPTAGSSEDDGRRNVTERFARVFWFGDFNFRVQKSRKVVDRLMRKNSNNEKYVISELLAHDQLNQVRGKIFNGFSEAPIHFMPTYKFDVHTDKYDTSSKQRIPSWTDRVLFKSKGDLEALCYNSCNTIKNSDHRPVYAIFETIIEPYNTKFVVTGAQFDRDVYVEANMRRTAPLGNQDQSHVCIIL